jgi:hypothetical protein
MRKALLIPLAIIAVGVVVLVVMLVRSRVPSPQVQVRFLEFTNASDGPAAVLGVLHRPRLVRCYWLEFKTSRRVDGAWQSWSPDKPRADHKFTHLNFPPPVARDGKPVTCLLLLPVANTNDGWRFVQKVEEAAPDPWPLWSRARDWWYRKGKGKRPLPPKLTMLPAYSITNETSRAAIR